MDKQLFFNTIKHIFLAVLCAFSVSLFTSCEDADEPEISVGYYLSVQSRVKIYSMGGMPPAPKENMIGEITKEMKHKINEVYPVHDLKGNDAAVIAVCDDVYDTYRQAKMHANTECVAILYRAKMSGIIVKQSTPIKSYRF